MQHNKPIRAAIFDIDGTLAMMDKTKGTYTALPGAVEALETLRAAKIPVIAYTNGTFFPISDYYPLLADAGLILDPDHIVTPAAVAVHHLKKLGYKRVMVFGADGTKIPMREAGFDVVDAVPGQDPVEAVMMGWTRDFGVPNLEAVCEAIWAGAVPFAGSDAPFFAGANGKILGVSGAVAAMVTKVTGQAPTVLGKPSTLGLDMSANILGCDVDEIAVIGDDPLLEIMMARKAGSLAIGVTTGIADQDAFNAVEPDLRAHLVIPSLSQLPLENWKA